MSTSTVELSNVSAHGIWLLVDDRELFLPFDEFPWLSEATLNGSGAVNTPVTRARDYTY